MIPFIKSFTELMLITNRREIRSEESEIKDLNNKLDESRENKRHIKTLSSKTLGLPSLPKPKRRKWVRSKEAVSRFFDELDYNNQIQSSYDLTLLERQNSHENHDVA